LAATFELQTFLHYYAGAYLHAILLLAMFIDALFHWSFYAASGVAKNLRSVVVFIAIFALSAMTVSCDFCVCETV